MNMPVEGGPLPGYPDVPYAQSCSMDRCMARAKENDGLGIQISMQGYGEMARSAESVLPWLCRDPLLQELT